MSSMLLSTLDSEVEGEEKPASPLAAVGLLLGGIVLLLGSGYLLREQIQGFLEFFVVAVEEWGTWGYVAYAAAYTILEVLAIPAIPLTMTAGV